VIKIIYAWRDRPDLSAEECEAHYRAVHMELAREAFDGAEGFISLTYNRVRSHFVNDFNRPDAIPKESDIDAYVELHYESQELLEQAFGRPAMAVMFDDHPNFMDVDTPANVRAYRIDESVFLGARPSVSG
jgi:hypothetical protein